MKQNKTRIEHDSLGPVAVPADVYWGAQTQRAIDNFPISGLKFPGSFIRALGLIKAAAAHTNNELGLLASDLAETIIKVCEQIIAAELDDQFPLDVFQTGSGTSTNMNANEVIANRANVLLGSALGSRKPVHPNDHVNLGQSSNDVIPSVIHIAACEEIVRRLLPALTGLQHELEACASRFAGTIKIGRTHLQDATPLGLDQEFRGYATMVRHGTERVSRSLHFLSELALGGTAVGTGLNTHPDFPARAIDYINQRTGLTFREAEDHFEAQGARDAIVETSAALKSVAVSLLKIANDIRWLGSGPRCGIGEIMIPAVQPGSSIMPGKVNPVIAEALCQVVAQVIGNDTCITIAGLSGNFELNVMMPVMAHNLLQSIALLASGTQVFTQKLVSGLKADRQRCEDMVEQSLAMITALSPVLGYDKAAAIAHEAYTTGKTVRQIMKENRLIPENELERLLDPRTMI